MLYIYYLNLKHSFPKLCTIDVQAGTLNLFGRLFQLTLIVILYRTQSWIKSKVNDPSIFVGRAGLTLQIE